MGLMNQYVSCTVFCILMIFFENEGQPVDFKKLYESKIYNRSFFLAYANL